MPFNKKCNALYNRNLTKIALANYTFHEILMILQINDSFNRCKIPLWLIVID